MADNTQRIVDLPQKVESEIYVSDDLMGIDAADGYLMTISELAKVIISKYNGFLANGQYAAIIEHIATLFNNDSSVNATLGSTDISSIGDGTVTGAISSVNATLGSTDISSIGDGTVTGAISSINSSLTISSGTFTFENCRSNGSAIYRIGEIVYFRIDVTATADISPGTAGSGFIQFPSGFRPNAGTAFYGMDASAGIAKQMYVSSGGTAQQTPTTIASGHVYRSSGMFIVP